MTAPPTPLRAGILGCGGIAQEGHIPALLAAGVEIAAVCDVNERRAEDVAKRFGVPAVSTDYEQLIALPDLDLVTIGLPNALHAPVAVSALTAGKHVLCEKPMSVDSVGAEAMLAAARASGRLLSVNQHMRFHRSALAMRDIVAAGTLGEVYLADVKMTRQNGIPGYGSWFTNRDLAGQGALFDIGVHMLDLALFVLGFPEVVAVNGYLSGRLGESRIGLGSWGIDRVPRGRFDVDDTAIATLILANGGQIRLHVAWAAFGPAEERITLYGTHGGADRAVDSGGGRPLRVFGSAANGEIVEVPSDLPALTESGWTASVASFVRAVREGEPLEVLPEQTLATTRILERIVESAAAGGRELLR